MTGLIIKDFLILRKSLRSYLFILLVYTALIFAGVWSAEFVSGFFMATVALLPANTFAYDKQAKWDVYGLTLPVSRTRTVTARYLSVLLLALGGLVLAAVAGILMKILGQIDYMGGYLLTCAVCGLLSLAFCAIMLPLLYKFGPERARLMCAGALGVAVLIGWFVLFPAGGLALLKAWEPTSAQLFAFPFLAAAAGLILLALSFLASRYFYGKQDV